MENEIQSCWRLRCIWRPSKLQKRSGFLSNANLMACLNYVKEKCGVDSPDLDTIYSENVDQSKTMGCYNRYEVKKDFSIETIWANLNKKEKSELFDYAKSWMEKGMVVPSELLRKIEFFEERGE